VQEAITLPTSWFGGGCPIRGWHLFIFVRNMWTLVPKCINRMYYKELWILLIRLSSTVRNGSSNRTHLLPTRPDDSGVGVGNDPAFNNTEDWPLEGFRPQAPGL
jgi:hypothetical protein